MQLKIKVTKDILRRAMYCGTTKGFISENCPIALAVRDIFPEAVVEYYHINPFKGSTLEIPHNAEQFIKRFDMLSGSPKDRLGLPEYEFTINIPDNVIEQINIEELRPLLINHPTLELV
jgi:hypothetical protein